MSLVACGGLGVAVTASLCGAIALGQHAPQVPVFSTELALVKVTVSVEDRRGRPVEGLSAADFILREDGRPCPITVYAGSDAPEGGRVSLALALLVDTSESMLESLRLSRQAATHFLTHVPSAHEVLVVLFAQEAQVLRFDAGRPEELSASLASATAGGNTALRDTIASTLARLRSPDGRVVMVLLTDGEDTVSRTSPEQLARMLQGNPVTLYPVASRGGTEGAAADRQAYAFLERLARLTGGRAFRLTGEGALPAVFSAILDELRGQYVLGYAPPRSQGGGGYRSIRVEVKGRGDLTVRHRPGYRLPPR